MTLEELRKIVDHQAGIKSLWPSAHSTIGEYALAMALRHLHAVIEGDEAVAALAKSKYWYMESEL